MSQQPIDPLDLAARVKAWRGKVPAHKAAEALGISARTLQGVEQGRGFNYPSLLLVAMHAIDPQQSEPAQ